MDAVALTPPLGAGVAIACAFPKGPPLLFSRGHVLEDWRFLNVCNLVGGS